MPGTSRLKSEEGFGLVELTIAMSVLAIGLLTLLATFSSGYMAMHRASTVGTASMLADRTLETFRGKQYANVNTGTTTTTYSSASNPASPDGQTYTVTSTVTTAVATNTSGSTARTMKFITVSVSDSNGRTWATEQSSIDPLGG